MLQLLLGLAMMSVVNVDLGAAGWRSINDGVMGGVSSGGMRQAGKGVVFSGELSLDNNGGFASVRRAVEGDLSSAGRVRLVVRGDGRQYQFRIRQDSGFDGVAWRAIFDTDGNWQDIEIPLADFVPVFRGRTVRQAGPLVASNIRQIGFLLADKTEGAFKLEIQGIEFLAPAPTAAP